MKLKCQCFSRRLAPFRSPAPTSSIPQPSAWAGGRGGGKSPSPIARIVPLVLALPILANPRHKPRNRAPSPRQVPQRLVGPPLHGKRDARNDGRPEHEPEQQASDPQHHAPDPREHLDRHQEHEHDQEEDDDVGRVGEKRVEAHEERVHDGRQEGEGLVLEEVERGRGRQEVGLE